MEYVSLSPARSSCLLKCFLFFLQVDISIQRSQLTYLFGKMGGGRRLLNHWSSLTFSHEYFHLTRSSVLQCVSQTLALRNALWNQEVHKVWEILHIIPQWNLIKFLRSPLVEELVFLEQFLVLLDQNVLGLTVLQTYAAGVGSKTSCIGITWVFTGNEECQATTKDLLSEPTF